MVKGLLRLRVPSTSGIIKSLEAPRFGRVGAVFQGNIQTYKTLKFVVCSLHVLRYTTVFQIPFMRYGSNFANSFGGGGVANRDVRCPAPLT